MNPTARRGLLVFATMAVAGLLIFSVMVYRAVDVETAGPEEAAQRFAGVRATLPPGKPVLTLDDNGKVLRRDIPPDRASTSIRQLRVLTYYAAGRRIVSADVPLWFFRTKGPAAQYALRDTGFDLDRLGLTPSDLQRYGPVVLIDHTRSSGDRLLVWTE